MSSLASLPFNGVCCSSLEHYLLNNRLLSVLCGTLLYVPFMLMLFILWIAQIPITMLINAIIYILCCDCRCFRSTVSALSIRKDKEFLEHMKRDSVLLTVDAQNSSPQEIQKQVMHNGAKKKQSITLIHWNVFGQLGRYWLRYPLLTKILQQLQPDILCLNEAITVHLWPFGTINTMKKINKTYNGFYISIYDILHDTLTILFRYSLCWRVIYELQSFCNVYFMISYWRKLFWYLSMRSTVVIQYVFLFFVGIICQFGNAILFKNKRLLFRSYIALQPGFRSAMKALYIVQDESGNVIKTVWIVTCHLTAQNEANFEGNSPCAKQCQKMLEWVEKGQNELYQADAIVICGDFNARPEFEPYKIMQSHGYKSAVMETQGEEKWTYPTGTWSYEIIKHHHEGETLDYVWLKSEDNELNIDEVRLIGNEGIEDKHLGQNIRIYPSDHLGIYCKFSV